MDCPNCGQHIDEESKFCTYCGAQLHETAEKPEEAAIILEDAPENHVHPQPETQDQQTSLFRSLGANFGHFMLTLAKKPSEAKKANSNDMYSSLLVIALFSLLIAASYYLAISSLSTNFFGAPAISFLDGFILPVIEYIMLFIIIAGLTYAGGRMIEQDNGFSDILAKYGARITPFLLLYVIGSILAMFQITAVSAVILFISILGTLLIAPTLILLEQSAGGRFDRVYVLIGIYIIVIILFGLLIQSIGRTFFHTFMGNMFG